MIRSLDRKLLRALVCATAMCFEAIAAWAAESLVAEEAAALGVGPLFGDAAVGSVATGLTAAEAAAVSGAAAEGAGAFTAGEVAAGTTEALGTGLKVGAVTETAAGLGSGISASAVPAASNAAVGGLGTGVAGAGAVAAGEAMGAGLANAGPFIATAANAGAAVAPEVLMPLAGLANAAGALGVGDAVTAAATGKSLLDTAKDFAPILSAGATLLGSAAAIQAAKSPGSAGTGTTVSTTDVATQPEVKPQGLPEQPASVASKGAQDPRSPSAIDLARRRRLAALGGEGSTLLTGGTGIDPASLSVGKATLLGQ